MAFPITSTSFSSTPILFNNSNSNSNFNSSTFNCYKINRFKLIKSKSIGLLINSNQLPNSTTSTSTPLNLGQVPPSPPSTSIRRRSFLLLCTSSSSLLLSEMDSSASEGVYPLHRSKTIHLVRHAQGIHNVAGEKDHSAYLSEDLFDAHLTTLGWQQVDNLRKHVHASGLSKSVELVVVSPLLRTMQTAVGAFGGEGSTGNDVPPLMAQNAGNSNRAAISSLNCPPFVAVELCREHLGVHPCDRRRTITEYKPMFPAIDFSLIENDGDVLWTADTREKNEHVAERGVKFMKWLLTREEKEIAVVTHSGFLYHTLGAYGDDCHPTLKKEMSKHFNNCELRSVVIVDRSMIGSNPSKTDFPGKIPSGTDVPSDAV